LSNPDGFLPGFGERAFLRHFLPAKPVQRCQVSGLADFESAETSEGGSHGLEDRGRKETLIYDGG